jgi:hypothetical protein
MKREATKLAPTANVPSPMEIVVSDVEALYDAVDNVNNAGKTIVLKPGSYVLTRRRAGQERPNKGRLELQRDMSLRGEDPSLCVLETSPTDLPIFEVIPNAKSGMIRTGRGNHTIEKLKIIAPSQAGSGISTDLPGSTETTVTIKQVKSGDPTSAHVTRGVDIRNTGTAVIGRHLKAFIEKCEFHGGSQGIRIANFLGTNDCQVSVEMSGNHCHDNFAGCLITNHNSASGVVEVRSDHDEFTDNRVGCAVIGCTVTASAILNATANRTKFVANKIVSKNNNGPLDQVTLHAGGIVVRGAEKAPDAPPNVAFNKNQVEIVLKHCSFDSNGPAGDVIAHGAFWRSTGVAGTENTATISLSGKNKFTLQATHSQPPESGTQTNKVIVTS